MVSGPNGKAYLAEHPGIPAFEFQRGKKLLLAVICGGMADGTALDDLTEEDLKYVFLLVEKDCRPANLRKGLHVVETDIIEHGKWTLFDTRILTYVDRVRAKKAEITPEGRGTILELFQAAKSLMNVDLGCMTKTLLSNDLTPAADDAGGSIVEPMTDHVSGTTELPHPNAQAESMDAITGTPVDQANSQFEFGGLGAAREGHDSLTASSLPGQGQIDSQYDLVASADEDDRIFEGTTTAHADARQAPPSGVTAPTKACTIPQDEKIIGPKPGAQDITKGPSTFRRPPPSADLAVTAKHAPQPSGAQQPPFPDGSHTDVDELDPLPEELDDTAHNGQLQYDPDSAVNDGSAVTESLRKHDRQDDEEGSGGSAAKKACVGADKPSVGFKRESGGRRKRKQRGKKKAAPAGSAL